MLIFAMYNTLFQKHLYIAPNNFLKTEQNEQRNSKIF